MTKINSIIKIIRTHELLKPVDLSIVLNILDPAADLKSEISIICECH